MTVHSTHVVAQATTVLVVVAVAAGGALYLFGGAPSIPPTASPSPAQSAATAVTPAATARWTTLWGRIIDASGRPVTGSVSAASGANPRSESGASTDTDGRWTISWLGTTGPYCVDATTTLPDFGNTTWKLPVDSSWAVPAHERVCAGTAEAPIDLVLPASTTVSGTVVDATGSVVLPAIGVRITMHAFSSDTQLEAQATVDKHGAFSLSLPRGTWRLWALAIRGIQGSYGFVQDVTVGGDPISGVTIRVDVPKAAT